MADHDHDDDNDDDGKAAAFEEYAAELQNQHRARYEGKYAVFRSLMEVVDHNERI